MNSAERKHIQAVARLGCMACRGMGIFTPDVEIHHIRTGMGMGERASHLDVIGLCAPHHRTGGYRVAIHSGRKAWEERFGTEVELLVQVKALLGVKQEGEGA